MALCRFSVPLLLRPLIPGHGITREVREYGMVAQLQVNDL